ncbi:MAG: radical SAM protein [Clostridia bacterium]|nr:radical SAM protein [Clostridia bacterium]
MKKEYIIPIFVPHLGCPHTCSFCNQREISGQTKQVTAKEVKETIKYYLSNFKDDSKYVEVAFFGGSFTAIEENMQNELLEAANEFVKQGKVNSIRISTRPDCITKEILKRLKKYHVKTIELGVQSSNDYILAKCQRGHTFEDVKKASKLIRWHGFTLGHQMMIGLPESTKLDEINTAKQLIKLKPKIVRIYPVLVIKGTALEKEYKQGEYRPLNIEQAVECSKEIMQLFSKSKVEVIRVGLQNTEEISDPSAKESQVIAGPYHPAFRQLVEASMWYDEIVAKIKHFNVKVMQVLITANPENVNAIIGHKRENILKLKEIYDVNVIVKPDTTVKKGKFHIEVEKTYEDALEEERQKTYHED